MKKIIMVVILLLSMLLQGCENKQEAIKQEQIKQEKIELEKIKQEGIKQEIVFIYNTYGFDGYYNDAYCITNTGNVVIFDLSQIPNKNATPNELYEYLEPDKLYEYAMENIDMSSSEPLMKEDDLYKCYQYLYDIDPDAKFESEDLGVVDGGYVFLYGVQISEEGKAKIITIEEFGNEEGTNTDKDAKKIVDIFDENKYYNQCFDLHYPD